MSRALPSRLPVLAVLVLDAWLCAQVLQLPARVRLEPPRPRTSLAAWAPCVAVGGAPVGWRAVQLGGARLSQRVERGPRWPAYLAQRGALSVRFEGDRALALGHCRFREENSSLRVIDEGGLELRMDARSLAPQGLLVARGQRVAGLLGLEQLGLLLAALLGSHLCLWMGERWRARGAWQGRVAGFVNLIAVFLAGVCVLLLWWARTQGG